MAPLTGGAATGGQLALAAELDYIKYFNEQLAIPGVTLKIVWEDTALDPVKEIVALRRFVERGVVALVLIDPAVVLKPLVAKDELPTLSLGITEDMMYPPGWVFSCFPTEAERFAVMADWIVEYWKGESPPGIAFATIDSPYGSNPLAQSEKYAESRGTEWVAAEFVSYLPLDVIPQLPRLSGTAAFVYIGPIWTVAAPVLRDAERLGLMGKIGFCGMDATLGRGTLEALGLAAEGYFIPKTYPAWNEMESPGIQWAYEMWSRYHGAGMIDDVYESAIQHPTIILEAIRRAIENVGHENLNGTALKEAMDSIKDFDVYGFATVTYKPDDHRGVTKVATYQAKEGEDSPYFRLAGGPDASAGGVTKESKEYRSNWKHHSRPPLKSPALAIPRLGQVTDAF